MCPHLDVFQIISLLDENHPGHNDIATNGIGENELEKITVGLHIPEK